MAKNGFSVRHFHLVAGILLAWVRLLNFHEAELKTGSQLTSLLRKLILGTKQPVFFINGREVKNE